MATKRSFAVGESFGVRYSFAVEEKSISIPIAVFSAISVTIGAGMVSVPKTAYEAGIFFAIGYFFLNLILTIFSIH
jgi:Na+/proline symporter